MATLLTQKKFDFVSHCPGLEGAFTVVEFSGFEGFSTCYRFEITLMAADPEIDMSAVLAHPATFTILREEGDIPFHGILTQFEQFHAIDEYAVYKTVLSPKLWWLSLTHHNQIFLDKTVPQVLEAVLLDGGLTADDFDLRLMDPGRYEPWEFICQYGESHLNFLSRWMEREGMYYFFEQTPAGEKVIITDTGMSHAEMPEGNTMSYSPPSGLDEPFREEVIHAFLCRQKLLPGRLHVQDYNYRTPSLNLTAEAPVVEGGRGEFHIYGEHLRTLREGSALANLRAEELRSHEKRFHGESTIPFLRPGYLFDLERHYRPGFNQQYLTIELEHAGSQTGFLISGIGKTLSESEERNYYRNNFVAIPSEVQYRHPATSVKPRFFGAINAAIDAEGSGEYAELDDQGRYKVRFPFDLSGRGGGKASHWVRMAQPYAGTDHGMHFPLHKGTEVLLTFIEGDPDRPIVASAVPNPEKPSVIRDATQTKAAITTSGQNKIHFEDQAGSQRILLQSPTQNSWIRIGSPGGKNSAAPKDKGGPPTPAVEDVDENSDGVRWRSDGKMWTEAMGMTGDYITGTPIDAPATVQGMIGDLRGYGPLGLRKHGSGNPGTALTYQKMLDDAHVSVEAVDTVNLQYGNAYDFGGYWNYSLGNSYAENHMNQDSSVTLNSKPERDKAAKGGPLPGAITAEGMGSLDDNTWIEKTFGGAGYEYTENKKSLSVATGCTEESHTYGQTSYEYKYTSTGTKTAYSKSGGGLNEEKKWCRDTGSLLSHSISKQYSNTMNTMDFKWANTSSASFTFSAKASADFNFAASISFAFDLAASVSIALKLGGSLSLSAAVAAEIEVKFAPAGWIKIENTKLTADFFGLEIKSEEAIKLENRLVKLETGVTDIKNKPTTIINQSISLTQINAVAIKNATLNLYT